MKCCVHCKQMKPIEAFNFKNLEKQKRQSYCRECTKQMLRDHYIAHTSYYLKKAHLRNERIRKEIRTFIWKYLSEHACVDCGNSNPVVLEFDHIDEKRDNISNLIKSATLHQVIIEIAKCEVRCANCHRIVTAKRQGWTKTNKPL